ncbi:unnamed protein product [Acanthoscelides obtectus]|uniref:Uncharacterized protein n=1 Tax=Acanthoscelides obtectus TaxID=200917 RepID=A0A9P0MES8_ACAOB|nr:unnamed protein product [Acanthoscelides obtectus]CAK1639192.1 hypothetical protein AOBTE_LOCUS11039 [Acanthoscelides obtectus]
MQEMAQQYRLSPKPPRTTLDIDSTLSIHMPATEMYNRRIGKSAGAYLDSFIGDQYENSSKHLRRSNSNYKKQFYTTTELSKVRN